MAEPTGHEDWYLKGVFAMSFMNLNDTFGDYVDRAGKVPKVNSEEDALAPSDTSIDAHADRHEDGGADEVSHNNLALAEDDHHIPEFTRLNDTPADYVGNAAKAHKVNATEDGLVASAASIDAHKGRHESGGADEILHNDMALNPDDHHAPVIPSGTKMLFKQSAAPSLWSFVSEDNDRALINTSTEADGGAIGGDWQLPNVNEHAVSESEMPSHSHGGCTGTVGNHNHGVNCSDFYDQINPQNAYPGEQGDGNSGYYSNAALTMASDMIGNAGGHHHSIATDSIGGDTSHAHSQVSTWRPSYVKVITCQKD